MSKKRKKTTPKKRASKRPKKNTRRKLVTPPKGGPRVSAALERERAATRRLRAELAKARAKPKKNAPRKKTRKKTRSVPREWWRACLATAEARRHPRDVASCNGAWWKLAPAQREAVCRRLGRSKHHRERRAAVAIARAEARRANPSSDDDARRAYELTHWGERGTRRLRTARAADPRSTATELGKLVSVVYLTKKGGDKSATEYEHEFEGPLPTLAFHRGGLLVAGGNYKVREGGITG
jgi:hypothetical protein